AIGSAWARKSACSPEPLAISRTRAPRATWRSSTRRIGSRLRAEAGGGGGAGGDTSGGVGPRGAPRPEKHPPRGRKGRRGRSYTRCRPRHAEWVLRVLAPATRGRGSAVATKDGAAPEGSGPAEEPCEGAAPERSGAAQEPCERAPRTRGDGNGRAPTWAE